MRKKEGKKNRGWSYLGLAFNAFAGLGMEVLYAFLLEPVIYGCTMQEWTPIQSILHWTITCITWGIFGFWLLRTARCKYEFGTYTGTGKVKAWQWGVIAFAILFNLVMSYMSWDGFKVIKEFQGKGILLFSFQYLYYAFETLLFLLIIVFGQKAFEEWFQNKNIPYGGILCGLTWGLAHAFTKNPAQGLEGILMGFILGSTYLLVNRDLRKAYILLFILFVI